MAVVAVVRFWYSSPEITVLMFLCNLRHTILQFLNLPRHMSEQIRSKDCIRVCKRRDREVPASICSRAWQHNVFVHRPVAHGHWHLSRDFVRVEHLFNVAREC
jgi:hypothetical protein